VPLHYTIYFGPIGPCAAVTLPLPAVGLGLIVGQYHPGRTQPPATLAPDDRLISLTWSAILLAVSLTYSTLLGPSFLP